jgi:molybdate transport system ATP-binding protein
LQFAGGQLWVPGEAGKRGAELRLRIRASDVSLCRVRPEQSTILNIFPAVIDSIRTDDAAAALIKVSLGEASILSRVTRRSVRELNLQQGDEVFAQIKSVAVRPTLSH